LKILLFTGVFLPNKGGAELMLHRLALYLSQQGHDILVLAPFLKALGEDSDQYPQLPYPVKRYWPARSNKVGLRFLARHLFDVYRDFKFDVLHCHSAYTQLYAAAFFSRRTGVPIVSRPHGSDIFPGVHVRKSVLKERKLRWAVSKSDHFIAQGGYLKSLLLELGAASANVACIGNAVDEEFSDYFDSANFGRDRHGEKYTPSFILAMGRLEKPKGFETLIRAWALYDRKNQILKIAGEGKDRARLEALVFELGLESSVEFLGFRSGRDKFELFEKARFLVFPSTQEGFSNTLVEACYAGLPSIAADIPANRDVIEDGVDGLIFERENVSDLVSKMTLLNEDEERLANISNSLMQARRQYSMDCIGEKYLDVYKRVISHKPQNSPPAHS
jgi:glycosyltransferase involved in cell wall biosynthesis